MKAALINSACLRSRPPSPSSWEMVGLIINGPRDIPPLSQMLKNADGYNGVVTLQGVQLKRRCL